jgi:hypothetical protein
MRSNKMGSQHVKNNDFPVYGTSKVSRDSGEASAEEGAILYGKMRQKDRAAAENEAVASMLSSSMREDN